MFRVAEYDRLIVKTRSAYINFSTLLVRKYSIR